MTIKPVSVLKFNTFGCPNVKTLSSSFFRAPLLYLQKCYEDLISLLYPLKTSENLRFSNVFRGYRREQGTFLKAWQSGVFLDLTFLNYLRTMFLSRRNQSFDLYCI